MLHQAKIEAQRGEDNTRLREIKSEINVLLDRKAWMWSQRSRVRWVSQGDSNTKYFHSQATQRHRKNKILGIKDEIGTWQDQPTEIAVVLVNYFQELFSSTRLNSTSSVLDQVQPVITSEMNNQLSSRFLASEVAMVLKEMASLKAPGPDDMPPHFYQHFWLLFNGDITQAALY